MIDILTLFVTTFILGYLVWRQYINTFMDGLTKISGPTTLPFIGGLLELLPPSRDLHQKYGETYKVALPYTVGIITMDLDLIELTMTSPATINKSIIYDFIRDWLGDGLLVSRSQKWRQRRKMITPAFHFKILEQFVHVFNKNNSVLIEQLAKVVVKDVKTVNVSQYTTLAAMDNIIETAMGVSMNAQINDQSDYVKATKCMAAMMYEHFVNPIKFNRYTNMLTLGYWKEKNALKVLRKFALDLIKSKRVALFNSKNNSKLSGDREDESIGIRKKTAFLDLLLQSTIDGQPLSDEDIKEEVDTFMFEGHDTVSAGISFALFCIAHNPDVQEKIMEEQRSIFKNDRNKDITTEDMTEMIYLEMVIKEALRLYPSVPNIARYTTEDIKFKNLLIKKGTNIGIPIYLIHKDPSNYQEPEKFIPERFLPEEQSARHPYAYLPFSAGHRNCIGQKFAMMELKSTLSQVCRHFVLSSTIPPHKCSIPSAIVLNSDNGVYINMKPRMW